MGFQNAFSIKKPEVKPIQSTANSFSISMSKPVAEVKPREDNEQERCDFLCTIEGRKLPVRIGIDGQLWFWITEEESIRRKKFNIRPFYGQHTVAKSGVDAASYLLAYCQPSTRRDEFIAFSRTRNQVKFALEKPKS